MPPKALALLRNNIEPRVSATALTVHATRALFRNEEWIPIESRNAQLVFVEESAQKGCGVTLDTACLTDRFELTRSRARTICEKNTKEATTASPPSGTL
jgi:hypothetical protein